MDESRRPVGASPVTGAAELVAAPPVVVVHGLWMPGAETAVLRRRLAAAGFTPYVFRYRSVSKGLDENARDLAALVRTLPGGPVHFVGHSLGGVLILRMLEIFPELQRGRVVCLGSPLTDCSAGRALGAWRFGRAIVGKSILEHVTRGCCGEWRGASEVGVIAGNLALGFGRLVANVPSPNDGTVAVAETRLPGAAHIVLPVTHLSMLWSAPVAEEVVAFLRGGKFV